MAIWFDDRLVALALLGQGVVLGSLSPSLRAVGIATTLLPQAELTFNSVLASYESGRADLAMLLEAQQQIRKARLNQIKAQAEAQIRLADIERLLGEDL